MENLNLVMIIVLLILSLINTFAIIGFSLFLYRKIDHKLDNKLDEIPKDLSEALTKMIVFLQKEFESNYAIHQQMTDWEHDVFQKIMQSFSENFSYMAKQQFLNENLLNNVLSSLGFKSKFDETEIEKPKRTYADPPNAVEIEGLKIVNGKPESK